jgi:hypothetical protein
MSHATLTPRDKKEHIYPARLRKGFVPGESRPRRLEASYRWLHMHMAMPSLGERELTAQHGTYANSAAERNPTHAALDIDCYCSANLQTVAGKETGVALVLESSRETNRTDQLYARCRCWRSHASLLRGRTSFHEGRAIIGSTSGAYTCTRGLYPR